MEEIMEEYNIYKYMMVLKILDILNGLIKFTFSNKQNCTSKQSFWVNLVNPENFL